MSPNTYYTSLQILRENEQRKKECMKACLGIHRQPFENRRKKSMLADRERDREREHFNSAQVVLFGWALNKCKAFDST